jgi:hypothetical protein
MSLRAEEVEIIASINFLGQTVLRNNEEGYVTESLIHV